MQTNAEYNGTTYDAGLRYVGAMSDVKNKVYYNCDDTDTAGVAYGEETYDYSGSCEVWRIIGVFDVSNSTTIEKRIKIINTASTFKASWDSSASDINGGCGINQWGESTLIDDSEYKGADLMQLLNGYYIGKVGSECKYNTGNDKSGFAKTCTAESLKSANMKPLTNTAKEMIDELVWHTYAVDINLYPMTSSNVMTAYLQEKGITKKYTGCKNTETIECTVDNVVRDNEWIGLVGLMSVSDMVYANGWLYKHSGTNINPWTISPAAYIDRAYNVWNAEYGAASYERAAKEYGVFPSLYLSSDIEIIGGDGDNEPYKLSIS